jgi:hypothetical protein
MKMIIEDAPMRPRAACMQGMIEMQQLFAVTAATPSATSCFFS